MLEESIGFTFSVMTESNLRKLQHHPNLRMHYLEALVSNNKGYRPIEGQTAMYDVIPLRDLKEISELRNQLLLGFSGIITDHALILFDYNYSTVTSVRLVILNEKLEIAYSEDWSKYLRIPFYRKGSALDTITKQDDEPLVSLKPDFSPDDPDPSRDNPLREEDEEEKA